MKDPFSSVVLPEGFKPTHLACTPCRERIEFDIGDAQSAAKILDFCRHHAPHVRAFLDGDWFGVRPVFRPGGVTP